MPINKFEASSPERVLKQAQQFRQTLHQNFTLPSNPNKSMYVEKVADYDLNEIKYSINRAQYQNSLFRKLERTDHINRKKINQSLLLRDNKVEKNLEKNYETEHKKHEMYSKHVTEVQKRYHEEEVKKFQKEKQEAIKLRREIKEFYEKQEQRKKLAQESQVKVSTCYENALERIHRIQKANEEFALKAQLDLQKSFIRNSPEKKIQMLKLRSTSLDFRKNEQIYEQSHQILKEKEDKFIQKFARNETTSLKAFEHKEDENQKTKKRIREKLKKDNEKWLEEKKRIDEQKAQVPAKCTQKMEKALRTTFRQTFSTFKDSFSKWRTTGEFNRSVIKENDDRRKDEIMRIHNDLTSRNRSIKEIDDNMFSMKQRASKVAADYL